MMIKSSILMLGLLAGMGTATAHPQKGRSAHAHCGDRYDQRSVSTLEGKVLLVETVAQERGLEAIHLRLRERSGEIVTVHLGPVDYLQSRGLRVAPHDEVTVTGSRVVCAGRAIVLASSIARAGLTIQLRDENGVPIWVKGKVPLRPPLAKGPASRR
jgi:hypothetical protein